MKKVLSVIIILLVTSAIKAQPFAGAHYLSNDAILTQIINPAFPAASDMKWQTNLFGFDASLGNNHFSLVGKPKDWIKHWDKNAYVQENLDGKPKNLYIGFNVMGPSFMYRIKKNTISFGTRVRAITTFNDLDENFITSLYNDFSHIQNWISNFSDTRLTGSVNVFHEFNLGYARSFKLKERHYLHAGASVKMTTNIFNAQLSVNHLDFNRYYNTGKSDTMINAGNTEFELLVSNAVTDNDFNYHFGINGFGVDAGAIYEFRKKNSEEHILMVGFSVNDMGFNEYKTGKYSRSFKGNNQDVPLSHLVESDNYTNINIDAILDSLGDYTIPSKKQKIYLPTTINVFVDARIVSKFYVNANFQFNPLSFKHGLGKANMPNDITITPRFETRIFSVFTPLNWNKYEGINFGAGIKIAQFTLGSKNIITSFAKKRFTGINFYMNVGFGKVKKKE